MTNVIESFSYGLPKVAVVQEAKDKAKKEGYSFSEYILSLLENDLKKEESPEIIPCISKALRQTTINEYTIIYINNLVQTPDENLIEVAKAHPNKKSVFEKMGVIRRTVAGWK